MRIDCCGHSHHKRWPVVLAPLFILSVVHPVCAAEQRSETVRMPDLSSYDCARVDAAAAPGDPTSADTVLGPLSSLSAAEGLQSQLDRAVEAR